ncbi:MAG: transglutaminase domain-containing protein [Candidatus Hadarchaeum sp.]|uniref:transglutaminase domain-containing protein n=1 Tax=Candidatus Hadarchaeum sp. TaxID=2883567 RepID=UPI003D09C79F
MKKVLVTLICLTLIAVLVGSTAPPVAAAEEGLSLTAEYTLRYQIQLPYQGTYYPGRTSIRVEIYDIPISSDRQKVQATLDQGSIQTINGRDVWVIETTTIYTNNIFTGTFVVTVDLTNTAAVPHQPLPTAVDEEVAQYLQPDEYVTVSAEVANQALQLVGEAGNDVPKIIAKFVDWIKKNVTYDEAKWAARLSGAKISDLTDNEMLMVRSGVCTDYANLFLGFCRAVGLPARSVLGYGLRSEEKDLYQEIQSATSHAWVEVWIPNYGWLTVDPTWGDIGDVRKIITAKTREEGWHYWYQDVPPGSGITASGVKYSIVLTGWEVVNKVTPVALALGEAGNELNFNLTNISPIPFLDNVLIRSCLWQDGTWSEWSDVSSEIIFLNPQETYTYRAAKESGVGYHVWSRMAENGLVNWQYPQTTTTYTTTPQETTPTGPSIPTELTEMLPFVVVIVIMAILGAIASTRRRRALPRQKPTATPEPEPEAATAPEPTRALAICPKCNARVPAEAKFCTECGADLKPRKRRT